MKPNINTTVLMSGVDYFDDGQAINPFMDSAVAIDRDAAAAEHRAIKQALESAGVTVHQVAPPEDCQDGVYTANWGLVRGDTAVMSRLPNARKAEEPYAETVLRNLGKKIVHLPDSLQRWSGQGDALPCGDYLFAGSAYRSEPAAQAFVADTLGYELIQLQAVPFRSFFGYHNGKIGRPATNQSSGWPDSFYYDIDLALSVLKFPDGDKKGLIAWCPAAFTRDSRAKLRALDGVDKIEVSEAEAKQAFACNLVSTGTHVIMNAGATQFAQALREHDLEPILLSNPELGKGGGSIRCTTLTLSN